MATVASAHVIISYPGWRGNNLITNETFPFGMQWDYPCGGVGTTKNRTYWPTTGGAVAFQPGWFRGHETAFIYINLGFGTDGPDNGPKDMSNPMLPPIQILGPSNGPYPGTVCFPQVPLPKDADVKPGDLATIQVVEHAVHGAALYSCVDIEFVEPGDSKVPEVNETNCFNSSEIGFAEMFTVATVNPATGKRYDEDNAAQPSASRHLTWLPVLLLGAAWALV